MSKAPDKTDHFEVLQAEVDDEPYRVEIPGKGKFVVPHVNSVDIIGLSEVVDEADSFLGMVIDVLEHVMPADEFKRLRDAKLSRTVLFSLYAAWSKHCGLGEEQGESPASSA